MNPPFLTDDEITEITEPLIQGAARIRFFRALGVKVTSKPNGQPLVGREEFTAAMASRRATAVIPADSAPNWEALDLRQHRRLRVVPHGT